MVYVTPNPQIGFGKVRKAVEDICRFGVLGEQKLRRKTCLFGFDGSGHCQDSWNEPPGVSVVALLAAAGPCPGSAPGSVPDPALSTLLAPAPPSRATRSQTAAAPSPSRGDGRPIAVLTARTGHFWFPSALRPLRRHLWCLRLLRQPRLTPSQPPTSVPGPWQ